MQMPPQKPYAAPKNNKTQTKQHGTPLVDHMTEKNHGTHGNIHLKHF